MKADRCPDSWTMVSLSFLTILMLRQSRSGYRSAPRRILLPVFSTARISPSPTSTGQLTPQSTLQPDFSDTASLLPSGILLLVKQETRSLSAALDLPSMRVRLPDILKEAPSHTVQTRQTSSMAVSRPVQMCVLQVSAEDISKEPSKVCPSVRMQVMS